MVWNIYNFIEKLNLNPSGTVDFWKSNKQFWFGSCSMAWNYFSAKESMRAQNWTNPLNVSKETNASHKRFGNSNLTFIFFFKPFFASKRSITMTAGCANGGINIFSGPLKWRFVYTADFWFPTCNKMRFWRRESSIYSNFTGVLLNIKFNSVVRSILVESNQ